MEEYIEYLEKELKQLEDYKASFGSQVLEDLNKWESNRLSYANGKIEIYKKVICSLKSPIMECTLTEKEKKKEKKKETVYMLGWVQKPNSVLTCFDRDNFMFRTTEPEICEMVYGDKASAERALQNLPEYMIQKFQVVRVIIKKKTEKVYKIKG